MGLFQVAHLLNVEQFTDLQNLCGRPGGEARQVGHYVSSTENAAKLGCFGLKSPDGDRESLKGIRFLKSSGNGEGG